MTAQAMPVSYEVLYTFEGTGRSINQNAPDGFGANLESADVNGDGVIDFIIGVPGEDSVEGPDAPIPGIFARDAGRIAIYSGVDGSFMYDYIGRGAGNSGFPGDRVGSAIAVLGDMNNNGTEDFMMGLPGYDNPPSTRFQNHGVVMMSDGQFNTFGLFALGVEPSTSLVVTQSQYGQRVARVGNMLNDGNVYGMASSDAGVHVFQVTDPNNTVPYSFTPSTAGATSGSEFGAAIAGPGDLNGDGFEDFLIAAPQDDTTGLTDNGSLFVYSGQTGTLLYELNGSLTGQRFGSVVSPTGDLNGDTRADFMVASQNGTIQVFDGVTGAELYTVSQPASSFAPSLDYLSDIDGDGINDLIIGDSAANSGDGLVSILSGADGSLLHNIDGMGGTFDILGTAVKSLGDINGDGYDDFMASGAGDAGLTTSGYVQVYTSVIPEPASIAILGIASCVLLRRHALASQKTSDKSDGELA